MAILSLVFFGVFVQIGPILERRPSALPEAQQSREVPLFNSRHVRSRVLHGSIRHGGSFHQGQSKCFLYPNRFFVNGLLRVRKCSINTQLCLCSSRYDMLCIHCFCSTPQVLRCGKYKDVTECGVSDCRLVSRDINASLF